MLSAVPRQGREEARPLDLRADTILRAAFGRYGGGAKARLAAAPIVARYQVEARGSWFLCDCRPGVPRAPLLVPVSRSHIRRVIDDHWPQHAEGCDFFREPAEQRLAIASQRRDAAERPLRLAPAVRPAVVELTQTIESRSAESYRPGIARLLLRLVWDAGLQRRGPGKLVPPVKDQVAALWRAARWIEIDQDVSLPDFLCTSPARLGELVGKIASGRGRFKRSRPHDRTDEGRSASSSGADRCVR